MTILSAQTIARRITAPWSKDATAPDIAKWRLIIEPFVPVAKQAMGMSYGLTAAGYDIRAGVLNSSDTTQSIILDPGDFCLIASLERVEIPHDLQVIVHDKSSWARQGLALQNTVLEPGWRGHITLELSNHGQTPLRIMRGQPIAQLVFHQLDYPTELPYSGKYQDQCHLPVHSIEMPDA